MFQHPLKSRRILAILVLAVLALVQVKVAFAGCMVADTGGPQVAAAMGTSTMGDCDKCNTSKSEDSYDILSKICSNHCLQDYVSPAKTAIQPLPAVTTVALAVTATAPPLIAPPEHISHPGKTRLIYRFLRIQI